jgi:hypothetical protein
VRNHKSLVMSTDKYTPFKVPSIVTGGRLNLRREKICVAPFVDSVGVKKSMKFQTLLNRQLVRARHCRKMRLS